MVGMSSHCSCYPACCVGNTADHEDPERSKLLLEKPRYDTDQGGKQIVQAHCKEEKIKKIETDKLLTNPRLLILSNPKL